MAIKKAELVDMFTQKQGCEIEELEKLIDEVLQSEYARNQVVRVALDERAYPHPKVLDEVIRRFKKAGWKIEIKNDQRGELGSNWLELS